MAETFVFTSPGAKFMEQNLTFVTRNVGITTLGLVGETLRGPAFQPIPIQDQTQFLNNFGAQSTQTFSNGTLQYQLPYVANTYLNESNQLYVTRVLGLSGYDAGNQWAITLSTGIDPSTISQDGSTTTGTTIFTNNIFMGVSLYQIGDTGNTFTGFTKTGSIFNGTLIKFIVKSITGSTGKVITSTYHLTGTSYAEYEGMVLATLRSRAYVQDNINSAPTTIFDINSLTMSGNTTIINTGNFLGEFVLIAAQSGNPTVLYTVSLNPNLTSYLPTVVGSSAKDKNTKIWVQSIYPDLLQLLDGSGDEFTNFGLTGISPYAFGVNTTMIKATTNVFTNYKTQFNTPETPWIVSQLLGSRIERLFKLISIADGDSANQEIKISFQNINPETYEFDIVIRDFYDTDSAPVVLESFSKCTMLQGTTNYVAQRIGTSDGQYTLVSNYVMLVLADNAPQEAFPAGFEGYEFNNYSTTITGSGNAGLAPKIFYKTEYALNDRVNKVYLGVSETAYSTDNALGTGFNENYFNFNNWINEGNNTISGFTKTNGFHMDSGATGYYTENGEIIGSFDVGAGPFKTVADIIDSTLPYSTSASRKFTVALSGGFDGWDVNRDIRSYGDEYRQLGIFDGVNSQVPATNDYQAWETAINTFSNPENITINVFATPGINWSDNNIMILDTIEMIEQQRTDSLYIIDSPDVDVPTTIGSANNNDVVAAQDIADIFGSAGIDSSYCCTYFPYIQMHDTQNNVNVYLPPTGEVAKAIAFTDNKAFPWFAPAGLNRGVTDAIKSKYKMSLPARDILYAAGINPMADFADAGTAIFGQKTLQVADNALNRINVRRLLLQIKVLISNICTRILFEQDDQTTIDQFLAKATPVLDAIKRERGLNAFQIKMDDTNNTPETEDQNELFGQIMLQPMRSIEFIGIKFTLTPTGASFAD
jgi:hypothetical protein